MVVSHVLCDRKELGFKNFLEVSTYDILDTRGIKDKPKARLRYHKGIRANIKQSSNLSCFLNMPMV